MKRRDFLTLLGSAAAARPVKARAQQRQPLIGFLSSGSSGPFAEMSAAYHQALGEVGYVAGRPLPFGCRSSAAALIGRPQCWQRTIG
jgi:putative ABC transport system substrate-binding protein